MGKIILVTGGVRSGKSLLGEKLAEAFENKIYVATAEAKDDEMIERIELHKKRRNLSWTTLEVPIEIAETIKICDKEACVLIDCIGFWVTNNLLADEEKYILDQNHFHEYMKLKTLDLIQALLSRQGDSIIVTNEAGFGLVPPYKLGRIFRDSLGTVNSMLAAAARDVYLCVAGLPLALKKDGVNRLD